MKAVTYQKPWPPKLLRIQSPHDLAVSLSCTIHGDRNVKPYLYLVLLSPDAPLGDSFIEAAPLSSFVYGG